MDVEIAVLHMFCLFFGEILIFKLFARFVLSCRLLRLCCFSHFMRFILFGINLALYGQSLCLLDACTVAKLHM